jgi:RsiW-degrading membrane proteinase PrsW (M82 family)
MALRRQTLRAVWCENGWIRFGLTGALLWGVSVVVTVLTKDTLLLPTVLLLGSFVVPVTWVRRAIEHNQVDDLPLPLILRTFVYGGVAGILSAALLETWLLRYVGQGFYIGVGLIEEAVKLAVLWRLSRRLTNRSMVDGLVLGATVGFGFAAFESSGYALNAFYGASGTSLRALIATEAVRGLVAPVSHGLWTAVAGAVLFRESRGGRFRLTGHLLGTYGFVSLLHAVWDLAPAFALSLTLFTSGKGWQLNLLGAQESLKVLIHGRIGVYQGLDDVILVLVGTIGLVTVHRYRMRALAARPNRRKRPNRPNRRKRSKRPNGLHPRQDHPWSGSSSDAGLGNRTSGLPDAMGPAARRRLSND